MENNAPNHGGTFSQKNECSFRLSGHASPAQRSASNSSCQSPVAALQKLGRNCLIYLRFISMLQEDFHLANKFPEVSTLAGPLKSLLCALLMQKLPRSWYILAETGIPAVLILTASLHHKQMYLDWLKVVV